MKFSKRIESIAHSPIRKFHSYAVEAKRRGKKIYHLNIGQPDILTPPEFFQAVREFQDPVLAYMPSQGIPELLEGMKNYYNRIGVPAEVEDIIVTTGGSEALTIAMACICDEGDEILIAEPFYTNYSGFVKEEGAKICPITTKAEDGYHFSSKESIEEKINERTRAIMVTNPGNPTGVVLSQQEVKWITELALEYDLFVITDEVYREFVYDGLEMFSFGTIEELADRLIIVDSISKRFSACGGRVGALVCRNSQLIQHAMKLCQGRLSTATLEQVGTAALYGLDPSYFDEIRMEYEKRRDICFEGLKAIEGIVCEKPMGAFYITAKLPIDDAETFLIWLLEEFDDEGETLMYAPVGGFYETSGLGKDEIRIAYVLKQEDLKRSMEILKKAIETYPGRKVK